MPKYTPDTIRQYATKTDTYEFQLRDEHFTNIPYELMNTNDMESIQNFMDENDSNLSDEEKQYLEGRLNAGVKIMSCQEDIPNHTNDEYYRKPSASLLGEPGGSWLELDVHQESSQTTQNGCWSVVYSTLLKNRGVDLSQQDVRAFRPFNNVEAHNLDPNVGVYINTDRQSSPMEMADLAIDTVPNVMMRELSFQADDKADENTKEAYLNAVCDQIKGRIRESLERHEPLALMSASHYVTVTGIDGDTIYYKDPNSSSANPDETYHASIKELVAPGLTIGGARGVSLSWLQDVQLSEDGMTIKGLPDHQLQTDAQGNVADVSGRAALPDIRQKKGVRSENHVDLNIPGKNYRMQDIAYVPKKLNMNVLKPIPDREPTMGMFDRFKGYMSTLLHIHGDSYRKYQDFNTKKATWDSIRAGRQRDQQSLANRPFDRRDWEVMADRVEESLDKLQKGISLLTSAQYGQAPIGAEIPTSRDLKAQAAQVESQMNLLTQKLHTLSGRLSPNEQQRLQTRLRTTSDSLDLCRESLGVRNVFGNDLADRFQPTVQKANQKTNTRKKSKDLLEQKSHGQKIDGHTY